VSVRGMGLTTEAQRTQRTQRTPTVLAVLCASVPLW
jgi:hypothetical protein